jgi:predicted metal-dependent hydrolase
LAGKGEARATIRVNRLLRTPAEHVSDEALAYLIYHELLHHLLPGHGHDATFRDYESRFPDAEAHDHFFDTLHEHWDTRPESYANDQE